MTDITPEDLRAAVAAGRVDEATAAGLLALAAERQGLRAALPEEDEPFEFFRGFGEIFVAVGLALLFGAMHGLGAVIDGDGLGAGLLPSVVGIGLAWMLARYFTLKRRMSLPSIALAVAYAVELAFLLLAVVGGLVGDAGGGAPVDDALIALIASALGMAGMAIYYRAFRLPFALAPLGAFGAGFAISLALLAAPGVDGEWSEASFDLLRAPVFATAILVFGVVAFVAAMRFDLMDRHRLGRFAACAFWLHILAAPALVNTVCLTLYNLGGPVGYLTAALAFLLIAALALAIDRRSFLMAGVVYAGLALGAAFEAAGGDSAFGSVVTIGLLGGGMTWLGAHWAGARARLMRALPDFALKARLPPY